MRHLREKGKFCESENMGNHTKLLTPDAVTSLYLFKMREVMQKSHMDIEADEG